MGFSFWRCRPDLNWCIAVLQTAALPLGYGTVWSGLRGSNSLPPPWQGGALPDELNPQKKRTYSLTASPLSCIHITIYHLLCQHFFIFSVFTFPTAFLVFSFWHHSPVLNELQQRANRVFKDIGQELI